MATTDFETALSYEDLVEYVDAVLPNDWAREGDLPGSWRAEFVMVLPKRPGFSWAEKVMIVVDDNVLRLDYGDGTDVEVTNPTRDLCAHFVALFQALAAARKADRVAKAGV